MVAKEPLDVWAVVAILSNAVGQLMFRMKIAVACYMPEDMLEMRRVRDATNAELLATREWEVRRDNSPVRCCRLGFLSIGLLGLSVCLGTCGTSRVTWCEK